MGFEVKKERLVLVILPLTGANHRKRLILTPQLSKVAIT